MKTLVFFTMTVLAVVLMSPALAQDEETPEVATPEVVVEDIQTVEAEADTTAMVVLGGMELFEVGPESIVGPEERAATFSEALLTAAEQAGQS